MAYIPPHKRQSTDVRAASPIPEAMQPQFQRNMNTSGKVFYADQAISKWFAVGLDDDGQFPPHIHLQPISNEYLERKTGEKPLALVNSVVTEEDSKLERTCSKNPWEIITENVHQELVSSFEILRNEMDDQGSEKIKPSLVARLGKFLFYSDYFDRCQTNFAGAPSNEDILDMHIYDVERLALEFEEALDMKLKKKDRSKTKRHQLAAESPSVGLESVNKTQVEETTLRKLRRSLYTDIPSYMENIIDGVVPVIGVDFKGEKDVYTVKLSDNTRPDATISCKCSVLENKKLHLYKVKLNKVRQMVIDVSCLDKNLDLRLMLCSRRILKDLTDDEMNSLRDLISSAVVDSDRKNGLKWPLGKTSSGGRYKVIGVGHAITKAYKSSSFRLEARDADRYDYRTRTGETTREIYLKLNRIVSEIQEPGAESDSISKMLEDILKLIWDKFLCCEGFLT